MLASSLLMISAMGATGANEGNAVADRLGGMLGDESLGAPTRNRRGCGGSRQPSWPTHQPRWPAPAPVPQPQFPPQPFAHPFPNANPFPHAMFGRRRAEVEEEAKELVDESLNLEEEDRRRVGCSGVPRPHHGWPAPAPVPQPFPQQPVFPPQPFQPVWQPIWGGRRRAEVTDEVSERVRRGCTGRWPSQPTTFPQPTAFPQPTPFQPTPFPQPTNPWFPVGRRRAEGEDMTLEELVEDLTGLDAKEILEKAEELMDMPLSELGISQTEALFMGGVFDKIFGDYLRAALDDDEDRRRAEKQVKSDSGLSEILDAFFEAFFDNLDTDSSEEDYERVVQKCATDFTNGALDCQIADFFRSNMRTSPFCGNVVRSFCGQIDTMCN